MTATILCYHKVGLESEEGRRLNVDPSRFASHVWFFERRNTHAVLARDLAGTWPKDGCICFTFDDAYKSTLTHAPEILEKHGMRGTFYAVAGKVGETSSWDSAAARPLAGWQPLAYAQDRGHEIGNHSLNHNPMMGMDPVLQVHEVVEADRILRNHGILPRTFCYPYGSLDATAMRAVREAGYAVGLALNKQIARPTEDRLALSRIVVAFSDALPMLLYRLYLRPKLRRPPRDRNSRLLEV